jgi:hypothetical protein
MTHGLMGSTALASVSWDNRQWRRQAATARRDARQPGRVPLVTRQGVPVGTVIRAVRTRRARTLVIPLAEFGRHMVILDAKGGTDSRAKAAETRPALTATVPLRVATWPDVPLCMWDIPPRELATLLHQLIDHGEGGAAYYADISQAAVMLAVAAPPGPPRSSRGFLDRLAPGWMDRAYAEGHPAVLSRVTAVKPHLGDIAMRYGTLFDRLGGALDGTAQLGDADAWYCILEGTAESSVAGARALALTELVARAATATSGHRQILLAADDYSAVSRRVPLSNLYERGRSLGLGVMVSAQSWEGLGADPTSGSASRPPQTAACSSYGPRRPRPWSPSPGLGESWRPAASS